MPAREQPPTVDGEMPTRATQAASDASALREVSDAVLCFARERSLTGALQGIVDAGRRVARARYAALGIPDGDGGFDRFIVSGVSEATWNRIGSLPRTHGLLGAMLDEGQPLRLADIRADPRFSGWPSTHPTMRSFLGVPIALKGEVLGAFYLASKIGARGFSEADQRAIEVLAAHAAVAMENARLWDRSRELTVMEERTRLASELHDAVSQSLFSLVFTAEAAVELLEQDPAAARERLRELQRLSRDAARELRSIVFELRPAELGEDGLALGLRKHVDLLARLHPVQFDCRIEEGVAMTPRVERELYRITQEAVGNALQHAAATRIELSLCRTTAGWALEVFDDGVGFDPEAPLVGRHLGLTSMRERAGAIGARLEVRSSPLSGCSIRVEVADGH
jgi:signal transduction histidine kinase